MSTMLNIVLPTDVKLNTPAQNSSKMAASGDKLKNGFARVLNKQADKNGTDDGSAKPKDGNLDQLMAAIAGLVLPASVNVLPNQNSGQATVGENADNGKNQLLQTVPVMDAKNQLLQTAPVVATKNQLQQTVPVVDAKNQLLNSMPVVAAKVPLPELASEGKVELGSSLGLKASQNQLATLLTKMTETSVDGNKNNEVAQIQAQLEAMTPLQVKQLIEKLQQTTISAKNVDNATVNTALLETVPTLTVMDSNNAVGKILAKPIDNKKIVAGQDSAPAIKVADFSELLGTVNVKPLTATQTILSVIAEVMGEKTNMVGVGDKEQLKVGTIGTDQTVKNPDVFANLLNQQVMKTDGQVNVAEVKQVPQQPVADPYNIPSQIIDQARLIEGQKNTEMIIQLKPEHLGELTFKVTVENGVVNASFHSNNSDVRNVIEASLQQLKQDMSNQGLKVENVSVYAGLGQFLSNGQRESQQKPQVKFQNKKIEGDFLDALDSTKTAESVSDGSGVDYRV
jgi:flagellar hook-length control protein FliK